MLPISLTAVEYLTINMRLSDQREVYGMRGHENPYLLAREVVLATSYGKAGIAAHRGVPCGIIGVSPLWPGVWSAWSFGTDDWRKGAVEMTRYALNVLRPFILERRAHRLQCESRVDHVDAHRWLSSMGAKPDGLLEGYGRDGSDYIMWSWNHVHSQATGPQAGPSAS